MKRNLVLFAAAAVTASALILSTILSPQAQSDDPAPDANPPEAAPSENDEGSMTLDRMGEIIALLDPEVETLREGVWRFTIEEKPVFVVTDKTNNRMRILVPVRSATDMTPEEVTRVLQANFDSALDSRYAIAKDVLWSAYIHPLRTLHDKQFIAGIGQTVNLAATYGTTFTSGLLTYGGGDSNEIIRRDLIDKLLKKGTPI